MKPFVIPFGYEDVDAINAALAEGRAVWYYDDKVLDENLQALDRWTFPEVWPEEWVPLGQTTDFEYEYEEDE